MLEILCRILFFLSMLVLYLNVTSTSIVILIVLGYLACIFTYYYFNNVRCAVDECFNYCNFNATKFSDCMNPSQVSGYFVNRKYNKVNNNSIGLLGNKKHFSPLCSPDGGFTKENSLFDHVGTSIIKSDFKNGELRSPVFKTSNVSLRSNKLSKDKLKITFGPKDIARKNVLGSSSFSSLRRYNNSNLDMETYMNVNSPGFTSRVVDKAAESASYHLKYPAVRQISSYRFDKFALRQLSRIPRVNSSTPAASVRIAPLDVTSVNLSSNEHTVTEEVHDSSKNNNILQVLKDMSRKRNYTQEETDRSGSTPKKSRKNEMKSVTTTSIYKRAHEDSPNDNPENKCRKKRCDDTDRDIVKMMSYTSGLSVQGFTWENQSKKRKSSKLEKSRNDSPEKLEKFRKISEECTEETIIKSASKEISTGEDECNMIIQSIHDEGENSIQVCVDTAPEHVDETDKEKQLVSFIDEDEEYVCVAGGKILNRTNCTFRKKLNSKKIDPVSVISTEPEYVCETNHIDDKVLKESLLNNLVNDVERKEEKNDSVIFYHNSIFEEMANKVLVEVEVHQPTTRVQTASTAKPLQPLTNKATLPFNTSVTMTAEASVTVKPTFESSKTLSNETKLTNPLLEKRPVGFTLDSKPIDVVDSPKVVDEVTSIAPSSKSVEQISTAPLAFSTSLTSNIPTLTMNTVTPVTIPSPTTMTKLTAEEQKSPALSTPLTLSSTPFTLTSSSNVSTSENTNPLLANSPPKTPGPVPFGNSTTDAIQNTSATPKILMFGNTVIAPTIVANSSSSNIFSTPTTTVPSTSPFSNTTQSKSMTRPSLAFGQSTTQASPTFDLSSKNASVQGGFKFGTSQPTVTTSSFNVNPASGTTITIDNTTSVFTATTTPSFSSCFTPTTTNSFSADKPPLFPSASNSVTPSFSFGAQNPNVFGATSAFNSGHAQSATVFGTQPTTTASQPSIFGVTSTQSLSFGTSVQPSSTPVFGTSVSQTQSSALGTNCQSPVFGQSSTSTAAQSVFGNATQTVGGGDSGPVFGKTNPSAMTSVPNSQFVFGAGNQTAPPPTATTFGAAAPAFGSGVGGQPAFGANATTTTFNFAAGTSNFGSNGGATSSTFAAGSNVQPSNNPMFSFGSNVDAAAGLSLQSAFQFRPTMPNQPSQPFTFGGSVPATAPASGGFSIGSGGGASNSRSRTIARPRKAK